MRDILTGLAILLILVLTAALAGPYFVDWNARRGEVETRISSFLGVPVSIRGPIDVKLLPTPRLTVAQVSASAGPDGPALSARGAVIEISIMPLLRGEVRVTDAVLDGVKLQAGLAADGSVEGIGTLGAALESATRVSVDRLSVRNGTIAVEDRATGATLSLDDIDLDADASSLVGPWRASGQMRAGGAPVAVRFATGAPEADGGSRVKLVVEAPSGSRRGELDGRLFASGPKGLRFDGRVAASGRLRWPDRDGFSPRPWAVGGTLAFEGRSGTLDGVEFDAGGDEGAVKFAGTGSVSLGQAPRLDLALESRQIDFDRPFSQQNPPAAAPFPTVAAAWLSSFGQEDALALPIPVGMTLKVTNAILGSDAVSNVEAKLSAAGGGFTVERFVATLPGSSSIEASGTASLAAGGQFSGRVAARSRDTPRLIAWLEGQGGRSSRLGDARELSAQADVTLSPTVIGARNMRFSLDRSNLQGTVRYTPPEDDVRGHVEALLTSDGLVIDQVLDPDVISAAARGIDVTLTLDARNVRLGQATGANVGAGRVGLKLSIGADGIAIDTLDMADVAGASVKASGHVGPDGGSMTAQVDAKRVEGLAEILRRIAPGRLPDLMAARAPALGPLKLRLSAERGKGRFSETLFTMDGNAAGSKLGGTARIGGPQGVDRVIGALSVESAEGVALLSQLGLDVVPLPGLGKGQLKLELDGRFGNGATLRLAGDVLGAKLRGDGRLGITATDPDLTGTLSFETQDVGLLTQVLALPGPDTLGRITATVRAEAALGGSTLSLRNVAGSVAGQAFSGNLLGNTGTGAVTGDLAFDRLSLGALAALNLGPLQAPLPGSLWPAGRFSTPLPPPFDARVTVKTKAADVGLPAAASDVGLKVHWAPDTLELGDVRGSIAGGTFTGSLGLRRQGTLASAAIRLTLKDVVLGQVAPGIPLGALLSGDLDGAGSGEGMAQLLGALSGGGSLHLARVTIPRLRLAALPEVTARFDAEQDPPDMPRVRDALSAGLDAAPLVLPALDTPVTLSAGILRAGPLNVAAGGVALQGLSSFDLRSGRFDARASIESRPPPEGWIGPAPQASLTWRSLRPGAPLDREVDVAGLTNVITTHAVSRELARIEAAEADLRERNYFLKRLKAARDARERELQAQEEARQAEEARKAEEIRKAEEARRAAEAEAARKAEEARRQELARQAEEARKAEEARQAEEARRAEDARKAEEARKAEDARRAEEARRVEEARRAEEKRRADEAAAAAAAAAQQQAPPPPVPDPPAQAPPPAPAPASVQPLVPRSDIATPMEVVPDTDDEERMKALEEATRLMGLSRPNVAVPKEALQPIPMRVIPSKPPPKPVPRPGIAP